MSPYRSFVIVAMLLIIGISVTLYQVLDSQRQPEQVAQLAAGIVFLPQGREIPDLALINQQGQAVNTRDLKGQWSLIFLGYTFCPDVCPTMLADLRQLVALLPSVSREHLRILMVSVDPNRDTPEQLRRYLGFFSPDFIGLTGDLQDIQSLSNTLGIPFIPGDMSRTDYRVDHSSNLAIIGPDGRLHGFVRAPLNIRRLAEQLPFLLERTDLGIKPSQPKG